MKGHAQQVIKKSVVCMNLPVPSSAVTVSVSVVVTLKLPTWLHARSSATARKHMQAQLVPVQPRSFLN